MKKTKTNKPSVKKVLLGYGLHIWFLLFLVNVVVIYVTQYHARGQTCFTKAQVATDSRCLYILSNKVYDKGSRKSPHHGHPCGTDVTSVVPSSHRNSAASYLNPNYVGDICVAPPVVPTATPTPTAVIPSPQCLGSCTTISQPQTFPTLNSGSPGSAGGTQSGGSSGNNGGILALLLAILQLLLQLVTFPFRRHQD